MIKQALEHIEEIAAVIGYKTFATIEFRYIA
jgi:hypothetical protein